MKKLICIILFLFMFSTMIQAQVKNDDKRPQLRLKFSFIGTWTILWQYCFNLYSPNTRTIYTGFIHHKRTESQHHLREMICDAKYVDKERIKKIWETE